MGRRKKNSQKQRGISSSRKKNNYPEKSNIYDKQIKVENTLDVFEIVYSVVLRPFITILRWFD